LPRYSYEAFDSSGKTVRGIISGGNIAESAAALRKQDLFITTLNEQAEPTAETTPAPSFKLKFILSSIRRDVELGKSLTGALERFPRIFPPVFTTILKTGEATGLLDTAMERAAGLWEEKLALRRQIVSSTAYPALILATAIGAVIFMVSYVIPRIVPFLESMGGKLPWNTRLLIALADNFPAVAPKVGIGLGIAAGVLALTHRLPAARYFLDRGKLLLPFVGPVFQYALIIQFARTLSLLINSGIPVVEALRLTGEGTGNTAAKRVIDRMIEHVLYGENLSEPLLEATNIFPPMVGNMVRVGEETGNVDSSLSMVADIYNEMLQTHLKRMAVLIEPVLILFLGGLVAFVAYALISAIIASYGRFA
jgi:type IV pilus assembly protein PilC